MRRRVLRTPDAAYVLTRKPTGRGYTLRKVGARTAPRSVAEREACYLIEKYGD